MLVLFFLKQISACDCCKVKSRTVRAVCCADGLRVSGRGNCQADLRKARTGPAGGRRTGPPSHRSCRSAERHSGGDRRILRPGRAKAGCAYVTVTCRVRHVSVPEQTLVMEDRTEIPMEDVVSINWLIGAILHKKLSIKNL